MVKYLLDVNKKTVYINYILYICVGKEKNIFKTKKKNEKYSSSFFLVLQNNNNYNINTNKHFTLRFVLCPRQ